MRELNAHHADRFGERLHVAALDQSKAVYGLWAEDVQGVTLRFQQGDPEEVGLNGFTPEAVLALLADKFSDDPEMSAHLGPTLEVLKARAAAKESGRVAEEKRRAGADAGAEEAEARAAEVAATEGAARAEEEARQAREAERLRLEDETARAAETGAQRLRDEERRV